jgi:predicted nucleotidyltransferase
MKKGKIEESNLLLVQKFKQRLSAITEDVQIILFGSTARGEATGNSDIDICIILPSLDRNIRDIILEVSWEVSFESGRVIAPVIVEKKEIETGSLRFSPFFQTVTKEGIRI